MYSDLKPMVVGDDLSLAATAGDALYTMVLPTGHRGSSFAQSHSAFTATRQATALTVYPCVLGKRIDNREDQPNRG